MFECLSHSQAIHRRGGASTTVGTVSVYVLIEFYCIPTAPHVFIFRSRGLCKGPVLAHLDCCMQMFCPSQLPSLNPFLKLRALQPAPSPNSSYFYSGLLLPFVYDAVAEQNPDPWYSAFHYSHPPLVERLQAIGSGSDSKKDA